LLVQVHTAGRPVSPVVFDEIPEARPKQACISSDFM
jgi:hypothetical protein